MRKKRKFGIILIIIVFLGIVSGCSDKNDKEKESKNTVQAFCEMYFDQLKYTKDDWIQEENAIMNASNKNSSNKNGKEQVINSRIKNNKKWNEILTIDCKCKLMANRVLPYFALENSPFKNYKIKEVKKYGDNDFMAIIELKRKDHSQNIKINIKLKKEKNNLKIDSVDFTELFDALKR